MSHIPQINGLRPLIEQKTDVSLGGIFGHVNIDDVPDEYTVAPPLKIKDQKNEDYCTGYTVTGVSEDQEEVELNPHFQMMAGCKVRGNYTDWGNDLRNAMGGAVNIGSLEEAHVPDFMRVAIEKGDRNFVLNWANWPSESFEKAKERAKGSYAKVDGRYDTFDNMRAAMWQFRAEKRSIAVGAMWKESWTKDTDGVITITPEPGSFGHAFKIFGWKLIDGTMYLKAQLSNGLVGDNGIYYFPREIVNTEFKPYGQFMFQDMPKETAKFYHLHGIKAGDSLIKQILKVIKNYLIMKI